MPNRFVDLKRLILPGAIYFVTVKTKHNFPYFRERIFCDLFVEELKWCKRIKGFKLFAWFLGYDHFHLLVQPNDEWGISDVIFSLKKQFTHNTNRVMGFVPIANRSTAAMNSGFSVVSVVFSVGAQALGRLPKIPRAQSILGINRDPRVPMGNGMNVDGGINDGQMGKMMDIITIRQRIQFIAKYGNQRPFPKFGWQKSFMDRRVRNDSELDRIWEYIRINPIKHAMPPGWPYVFTNPKFADLLDDYGLN